MTFTRLSKERLEQVKRVFTPVKTGVILKGNTRDIGVFITDQELQDIFDFYNFKQTGEYLDWLKYNLEARYGG